MWHSARVFLVSASACGISVSALAADLPLGSSRLRRLRTYRRFHGRGSTLEANSGGCRQTPLYHRCSGIGNAILGLIHIQQEWPELRGLAGYNYQMGNWVVGVEGDFEGWTVGTIHERQ